MTLAEKINYELEHVEEKMQRELTPSEIGTIQLQVNHEFTHVPCKT